jgi:G3E family GTPase
VTKRGQLLPVTVISGFFGAGKSSLTSQLLRTAGSRRIAVATCFSQHDVYASVSRVAGETQAEYLLLECGGSSDPMSVAAQFIADGTGSPPLANIARIDSMVTVVDTETMLDRFCSWNTLAEEGLAVTDDGFRLVVDVVTEQLEFADVIVLNKIDCVSERTARSVEMLAKALNSGARVIKGEWGYLPPQEILDTQRFDFVRTRNMAGWARAFDICRDKHANAEGISSFLYQARRPFHPHRFMQFLRAEWPGVVRSRGHFWLATRMDWMGELIQAGGARRHRAAGAWWATMLAENPVDARAMEQTLGTDWDPSFGDRRQELAFVGIDMDEADLCAQLDHSLLTSEEMRRGPEVWQAYADPFPPWDAGITHSRTTALN